MFGHTAAKVDVTFTRVSWALPLTGNLVTWRECGLLPRVLNDEVAISTQVIVMGLATNKVIVNENNVFGVLLAEPDA